MLVQLDADDGSVVWKVDAFTDRERGYVTAYDIHTGEQVWDGMAYDPELNLLYVGTGNAAPYPRKLRSPSGGDNLYLASILAINPDTGRMVWYYQTTPQENWDFTTTQKMILTDLTIEGKERKVIMRAPKNGFFYTINRVSGELISAKPKLVFPSSAGGHN